MKYLFDIKNKLALEKILKDRYLILFLDYDGTLTKIAKTPDRVIISSKTKNILKKIIENNFCKITIISGRALDNIKKIISLKGIIYVGNHGLEIEGPKIKFKSPINLKYRILVEEIKKELIAKFSDIKGIFIEDKGLSIAIHYRLVAKEKIALIKTIFHKTIIIHLVKNRIKIKTGKKVIEIRPPIDWDKGKALLWLLARYKFMLPKKKILPIYIGDDLTDEDAFNVLRNKGLSIFVGTPRRSYAKYYLKNVKEVENFLIKILTIKNI